MENYKQMPWGNTVQNLICIDSDIDKEMFIDDKYNIKITILSKEEKDWLNKFYKDNRIFIPYTKEIKDANHKIVFNRSNEKIESEIVQLLNRSLRLFIIGNAGILFTLKFDNKKQDGPITRYVESSDYFYVLPRTKLCKATFNTFINAYKVIKNKKDDKKFNLITQKYLCSTGGWFQELESRFLDLTIILEILYHPFEKGFISHQLAKRSALILGNHANDVFGIQAKDELYKQFKEIYSIRSTLVHQGYTDNEKLSEYYVKLVEYCRFSLILYACHSELFEDNYLKKIVPLSDKYKNDCISQF